MTWGQFWEGDADLCRAYREADRLRARRADELAWIQGSYFYEVMVAVAPMYRTFSKNPKPRRYPEKPHIQAAEDKRAEGTRAQRLRNGEWLARQIAARVGRWQDAHRGE